MTLLKRLVLWVDGVNVEKQAAEAWRNEYFRLRDAVIPCSGVVGPIVVARALEHREMASIRNESAFAVLSERLARAVEADADVHGCGLVLDRALSEYRALSPRRS